jgi:hypothetical protein
MSAIAKKDLRKVEHWFTRTMFNPNTEVKMILAQEQAILKGKTQFEHIAAFVRQASAAGQPIHEVELGLWKQLLLLGHAMLEGFIAGAGSGDLGPALEHEGRTLRRLEQTHARRYVSIFGELPIERHVYGTRQTQKHEVVPLDARLELPGSEFSYVLQDWDQQLCVQGPYGEARGTVRKILGLCQPVASLEKMNLEMAKQAESFFQSRPAPPPKQRLQRRAHAKG